MRARVRKRPDQYQDDYPLVAGVETEVKSAEADALEAADVPGLLAEYRAGSEDAKTELIKGFRWLVYDRCKIDDAHEVELWGPLYDGFRVAIDRLARNKVDNAERYIRNELERCIPEYYREISLNIIPPRSTNRERKKAGLDLYDPLKRKSRVTQEFRNDKTEYGEWIKVFGVNGIDAIDAERLQAAAKSPFDAIDVADECDFIESLADPDFPDELEIIRDLRGGMTEREIARTRKNTSRYRVAQVRDLIRQRAAPYENYMLK